MNKLFNKNYVDPSITFHKTDDGYIIISPLCAEFALGMNGVPFFGKGLRIKKMGVIKIHKDDYRIFMDRVLMYTMACLNNQILKDQMEALFCNI